ncbi:MAG: VOC family protein [Actinobacteria bacterium]|nr:VOC family protein [Actinomycetota bacterium]
MRLDHFAIGADDLGRTREWYTEVLGLREIETEGGRHYLACGGRTGFDLVLEAGGPGLRHVAYACFDLDEYEAAAARLREAGLPAAPVDVLGPGIERAEAASLPGGQVVRLVLRIGEDHYLRVAGWESAAAHSPRDIDHVNIAVRDVDATVEALDRALGLRLSDVHNVEGPGNVGAWMRAGDRHHDFAIIRNRSDGLHHIAYQLADAAAMIGFADRLAFSGTTAEYGVGRHGPGSNLFLYVRDPSGNRVELTADMAAVPAGAPHRIWRGKDPSIVNSIAPYPPPRTFWEIT